MIPNLHFYVAPLSRIQFHSRICRVEVHPVLRNPVGKCKFEIEGIKHRHNKQKNSGSLLVNVILKNASTYN